MEISVNGVFAQFEVEQIRGSMTARGCTEVEYELFRFIYV